MRKNRRVVVTGIGLRSPIGNSLEELTDSLLNNRSGVKKMPQWNSIDNLRTKVAGVCDNVDEKEIPRKYRRSMGRVAILAALGVQDAIRDSGLDDNMIASPECGLSFGSTAGSSQSMEDFLKQIFENNSLKGMQSSIYLQFMSHTCAANLAMMFQIQGPVIASCTACVSGSQGIGFGYDAIKNERATIMLTGGAEEMHFMDAGVFDIMRATSTKYNDNPEMTPRPFDSDRDGLVVGEGGACLVLEEYEFAKKRNARIYAEIIGYGTNCDGSHLTNPSVKGMQGVMQLALKDAGVPPDKIGHINAHATATEAGDIAESQATFAVFGDNTPITGFKGYMGHTLGACGTIESIITILMMREGFIAPTRNLTDPDTNCAIVNHVMEEIHKLKFSIGMNNNFAFGGINTSLILSLI
ncbi:MAG: beta-ketoacyl-ACP synthase [Spirochaetota bacterium]|nr:beta-ketoacyl-ACP synthase [Spirochaetota bacterium]